MTKQVRKRRKTTFPDPIRWEEARESDDDFYFFNRGAVILYDETGPDGRRRILTGEPDPELRDCDSVAVRLREEGNGAAARDVRVGKTVVLSDYADSVDEIKVKDYEEEKDGYTQETRDYLWRLGATFADTEYAAFDLAPLAECGGAAEILKSFLRDLFYRYLRNEYRCIQEGPLNEKALKRMCEDRERRRREWTEIGRSPRRHRARRKIIETVFTEQEEFFSGYGSDGHRYRLVARYGGENNFFSLWLEGEKRSALIGEIIDMTEYEDAVWQLDRVREKRDRGGDLKPAGRDRDLRETISRISAAADTRKWDLSPLSVIHGGALIVEKYMGLVYKRWAEITIRYPSLAVPAKNPRGWRMTKKDRRTLERFVKKVQDSRPEE